MRLGYVLGGIDGFLELLQLAKAPGFQGSKGETRPERGPWGFFGRGFIRDYVRGISWLVFWVSTLGFRELHFRV